MLAFCQILPFLVCLLCLFCASLAATNDLQQQCDPGQGQTSGIDSDSGSDISWAPLESFDGRGQDLLASEPEPMRAVVEGRASCVVLRGVLDKQECGAALARLAEKQLLVSGDRAGGDADLGAGTLALEFPFRRLSRLTDVGVTLHGPTVEQWQEAASRQNELFGERWERLFAGLSTNPVARLHGVLDTLAGGSGKRVAVPADMVGGVRGTDAIVRAHHPGGGSQFTPHFDGFQQGPMTPASLQRERPYLVMDPAFSPHAVMSAVLVLQTADDEDGEGSNASGADSRLFNISLVELMELAQAEDQITAASHWIGVNFQPSFYAFADRVRARRFSPRLRQGDMYLFSASRVHETFELHGGRSRVVVASFMAWHEDLEEVLLFQ